ncbi:MAG: phospholipase [Burkholderiaceae bacterium]|nr:phospholipase [Burkholderiaceae bacterium]
MAKEYTRKETTHIDEVKRTAACSVQWLPELRNAKVNASHPITHNNRLTMFICGEQGFADIAAHIRAAQESIDLICWGFDPGMELERGQGAAWPRGETFGDVLIAAGKRGVTVRLLVWYDKLGGGTAKNMPGYTHGTYPWYYRSGDAGADEINAKASLQRIQDAINSAPVPTKPMLRADYVNFLKVNKNTLNRRAREEYCHSWYKAAQKNLLTRIRFRTRSGSREDIVRSLAQEPIQPAGLTKGELEKGILENFGSHHQKTILIDYAHDEGRHAVGYVIGLNSVTDYWDTTSHLVEDIRREQGGEAEADECVQDKQDDPGFQTLKPFQDYACRLDGGGALIAVYRNFVQAWDRAVKDQTHEASKDCTSREAGCASPPVALLRKAQPGDSTVQVVRTQPEEDDKSIREMYWLATSMAANTSGYLYIENQYFQYEAWAKHLLQARKAAVEKWRKGCAAAGKSVEDLPIMHVLVVIPAPERAQMIPRTHDTLATLGQHQGMTGQNEMIKDRNLRKPRQTTDEFGASTPVVDQLPDVVQHANSIHKPSVQELEATYGLKINISMLNACGFENGRWRYREIYIHSKLMIANDAFFTLGSANLNQRSMAVDSELNIAVQDPALASTLRRQVWALLGGEEFGTQQIDREKFFRNWVNRGLKNKVRKLGSGEKVDERKMTGFLLPFEEKRFSTSRLG